MRPLIVHPATPIALGASALLAACSSLSGLDGTSSYACKAPEGIKCESVSGTYHNAIRNNLPSQRPAGSKQSAPLGPESIISGHAGPGRVSTSATSAEAPVLVPAPLRAAPRVLRLWIKPWEDADLDLNGESHVYVQVDNGRWLIDHVQRRAREPYAPVRPTKLPTPAKAAAEPARSSSARAPEDATSLGTALRGLPTRNPARAGSQSDD